MRTGFEDAPAGIAEPATQITPSAAAEVVTLATIAPERVTWLWPGYLPLGKLVVVDGDPSTGKSTMTMDLARPVTTGAPWPDGSVGSIRGGVLLLSAEDGLADTIVPRLSAAGADLSRVHALTEVPTSDANGARQMVPPSLPRDIPVIESLIRKHSVRLVVVDVLMAYLSSGVDAHRDQDVRAVLHRLAAMAESTGCTVILVRHMNKAGGTNALYRGGGSIGIVGAARAAYIVARDPEDTDRRIFAVTKLNIGIEPPALAYRLQTDEAYGCARVVWDTEPVKYNAGDLMRAPLDGDERTERDDAAEWLRDRLMNAGGTAPSREIKDAARKAGHQTRTLQRAREALGVVAERSGFPAVSYWSLPDAVVPPSQGTTGVAQLIPRGTTGPDLRKQYDTRGTTGAVPITGGTTGGTTDLTSGNLPVKVPDSSVVPPAPSVQVAPPRTDDQECSTRGCSNLTRTGGQCISCAIDGAA